jgi:hypothetical protein
MLRERTDLADRCLCAVHGYQPVAGAVAAYRRMFTGYTLDNGLTGIDVDIMLKEIVGDFSLQYVTITSGVQGGWELFPTKQYPESWLHVSDAEPGSGVPTPLTPERATKAYKEGRYSVVELPGVEETDADLLRDELTRRIETTESFHDWLGLYQLPGRTWSVVGTGVETDLGVRLYTIPADDGEDAETVVEVIRGPEGDGTVPAASAGVLFPSQTGNGAGSVPSEALRQIALDVRGDNFGHQGGWDVPDARRFAIQAFRLSLAGTVEAL